MENYDSAFNTIDEYVKYVELAIQIYVKEELVPYFRQTLISSAQEHVYDVYTPVEHGYKRQYTMLNASLYGVDFKEKNSADLSESIIYVYSQSPHAMIVVNGQPYDYKFKFNGKPRPFGLRAVENVVEELPSVTYSLSRYLNRQGIETV